MSSYGPQGGPYPGQPQDPWQDGSASDPYHTGYPDPLTESSYVAQQYGPGPRPDHTPNSVSGEVWGPPQAPVRPGRSATAIGVIIVVVLLAIGVATAAAVYLTRGDEKADGPTTPTSGSPSATASKSPTGNSTANADAKVAQTGDCLVNKGSANEPDMQKVTCGPNTYEVLKRLNGTADYEQCKGTPNLTDWYFFDHSDNAQDFVLCLRKR